MSNETCGLRGGGISEVRKSLNFSCVSAVFDIL